LTGFFSAMVLGRCLELPTLLPIVELAEALLHVQNGAWLLCRVVANAPDSFYEGSYVRRKSLSVLVQFEIKYSMQS